MIWLSYVNPFLKFGLMFHAPIYNTKTNVVCGSFPSAGIGLPTAGIGLPTAVFVFPTAIMDFPAQARAVRMDGDRQ